ncbi:MAG: ribosome maturation factor RimP [Deltaproteobacteria bacterium]|jgi:ribosome maturation factor RimP|nr:ribosome maturation factor RimP [Deltaproteobacteria bacterium]
MKVLENIVKEVVESAGYELWQLSWSSSRGQKILKVLIEHDQGVNISGCAKVSKLLGPRLEVEDFIKHAYRLEVSSPGLDRPLITLSHFKRYQGEKVNIKLKKKHENGKKKFTGTIEKVKDDGEILMKIRREEFWISLDDISKANLAYDFNKK